MEVYKEKHKNKDLGTSKQCCDKEGGKIIRKDLACIEIILRVLTDETEILSFTLFEHVHYLL